jgi:hypothetical protein
MAHFLAGLSLSILYAGKPTLLTGFCSARGVPISRNGGETTDDQAGRCQTNSQGTDFAIRCVMEIQRCTAIHRPATKRLRFLPSKFVDRFRNVC